MSKSLYMNYLGTIAEFDEAAIGPIRQLWMTTDGPDKARWATRLDELLDQRLKMMKARDAAKALEATP